MHPFHNQVRLVGRAASAPEFHLLTDGTEVARLRLYATTGPTERGSPAQQAFSLVGWGAVARLLHAHVRKGARLSVQGYLRNRSFRRGGQTHVRTEIHVRHFQRVVPLKEPEAANLDACETVVI